MIHGVTWMMAVAGVRNLAGNSPLRTAGSLASAMVSSQPFSTHSGAMVLALPAMYSRSAAKLPVWASPE